MTTYKYICPECQHEYSEQRNVDEPQWFTKCNAGCDTDYIITE